MSAVRISSKSSAGFRPAERRLRHQPQQRQAAACLRDVEAEFAAVERLARAERRRAERIGVVADERARRAPRPYALAGGNVQPVHRKTAQHPHERQHHRPPFAEAERAPPLLARLDHVGIDADRRVVDEDAAVDLAHVDVARAPLRDEQRREFDDRRDAQVLGEVVERAERQHAERNARARQMPRRRADGPVAAADDQRVEREAVARPARSQRRLHGGRQFGAADQLDRRVDVGRGESVGDGLMDALGPGYGAGLALDVEDRQHAHALRTARRAGVELGGRGRFEKIGHRAIGTAPGRTKFTGSAARPAAR